ncbi:MAG: aminotransferase class IV [Candidatus Moraniibacteriota bacterium]
MNRFCYYNGAIVELGEVKISPYDLGFMRGYGIFDAMRTINGTLFCFDEHWDKFEKSAQDLGLKLPIAKNDFREAVDVLLKKNNLKEGAIKTILTGGESDNGFNKLENSTLLILVDDLNKFLVAPKFYEKGWKIIFLESQRFLPEIKTLNYLIPIKNQNNKIAREAQEIVYKKDGKILECSTSNIFMIKDGVIITPRENVFLGTIRNLVVKIAKNNGFEVEERDITMDEFLLADEVFLTATYKKIIPVVNVDDTLVKNGQVGEKTKELIKLLDEFIKNYSQEIK